MGEGNCGPGYTEGVNNPPDDSRRIYPLNDLEKTRGPVVFCLERSFPSARSDHFAFMKSGLGRLFVFSLPWERVIWLPTAVL